MTTEQSMMSKTSDVSSQGPPHRENIGAPTPQPGPPEHQTSRSRNQVFKSGPLFLSSKGIGWTSWKKRWFMLTRTSLVFFRSDPSQASQKGGETNLTLGGIDLNNSATVEVKADKKLLIVFYPDGRDGRAFTLKAETIEDLQEWKTALEKAVALAPSPTNSPGKNDQADDYNVAAYEQKDGPPGKSMVLGRPILLALEDIDGSPSFLEKALQFIEQHGVRVEGVLRQAADVDEVYHRVHEYEQGKTEFSPDEDAHIIGDCIKYILRELPSSPVPASCCNALLTAYRTDRNNRANSMRTAILETFPEPNRRLLQRMLQMMQIVASNKTVNRMSTSAVAACMSPLLLRPLLAGECELGDTHMDVAGDGSLQLLQAAAAANHAQAIIITLLDEYDKIFGDEDGSLSDGGLFSDSDDSGSGSEEGSDDDMYDDDDDYIEDDNHDDASDDLEETDDDYEHSVAESYSGSDGDHGESDSKDDKHIQRPGSFSKSPGEAHSSLASNKSVSVSPHSSESQHDHSVDEMKRKDDRLVSKIDSIKLHSNTPAEVSTKGPGAIPETGSQMSATEILGASEVKHQRSKRTATKKSHSMKSTNFQHDDEDEIERLEAEKHELENRIEEEATSNSKLQEGLERRKKALHERRLALEKDVTMLKEQLQKERELQATLQTHYQTDIARMPEKTKIELQKIKLAEEKFSNLKQRIDDIQDELHHQHNETVSLLKDRNIEVPDALSQWTMSMSNKDSEMKDELHHRGSSTNEGQGKMDGEDHGFKWKHQSSKKNQNQPTDVPRGGSSKFGWFSGHSSSTEASITKPSPSTLRKSSLKGEGSSNTTSALTKLSTRLNFLKERRNQIANELQNIDKGRGSSTQSALSPGKEKGPAPTHNSNKSQSTGCGFSEKHDHVPQPSHTSGKGSSTQVDNNKKSDNQSGNKNGSTSRPESSSLQNEQRTDKLKSEGGQSSSKNLDKSRQDSKISRTLSK